MRDTESPSLLGAHLLVALARWHFSSDTEVAEFFRAFVLLGNPELFRIAVDPRTRGALQDFAQFSDSASAVLGTYPLIDALKQNKKELTPTRLRKAQERAKKILDALIDSSRSASTAGAAGEILQTHPALRVVSRELRHRFILPAWMIASNPRLRRNDVPGWGRWQPVISSLEDLLTWATGNALATGTAAHIGKCDQCGQYYASTRRQAHRFCADTNCRDTYWRLRTGPERVKRSRAKRRDTKSDGDHIGPR